MYKLFITELKRHRALAIVVAALHFMTLYYVYTLGRSVLVMPGAVLWTFLCIGLSAGFAVFQMAQYKRDNNWIYLLHRPLHTQHVFLALLLAGWCLVLLATVLPLFMIVLAMDGNALNGIEWRHYQAVPYAALTAVISYCCGCFAILSASRLGFFALSMATALVIVDVGSSIWIKALLLLPWSYMLARAAFKPDLQQAPRKVGTLLLTELPIQYGCLWLIVLVTTLGLALNDYISGTDPSRNPPPGTENFVWLMPPKDAMQLALDNSAHKDAAFLKQQVLLGETIFVEPPNNRNRAERHQMPRLDTSLVLADMEKNITWQFSHDHMLYEGHNTNTREFMGWLGPDGFHAPGPEPQLRFTTIPWTSTNQYIISDHDIYQIDWDEGQVYHRYHKNDGTPFMNALTIGEHTAAQLSDDSLYLFSAAELSNTSVALHPNAVLKLTSNEAPRLRSIFLLPLVDGYLVSLINNHTPFDIATDFAIINRAQQELFRLHNGSEPELIVSTALPSTLDQWFFYKELVLAPGMRLFTDLVWGLHSHLGPRYTLPLFYVDFPAKILFATAFVCLFSAGTTAVMLRRSRAPLRIRLFWIIGNAITGIAGLLSFFIGYYWKRPDELMIPPPSHSQDQKG